MEDLQDLREFRLPGLTAPQPQAGGRTTTPIFHICGWCTKTCGPRARR